MSQRLDDIKTIHQKGLAVEHKRYVSDEGVTYVGMANGRLKRLDADVLELQEEVANLEAELDALEVTVGAITPAPAAILSYFENDGGVLTPIDVFSSVLPFNVFSLDLLNSALVPSTDTSYTDIHFEFDSGLIIPKVA
jgi:hypothetical protein